MKPATAYPNVYVPGKVLAEYDRVTQATTASTLVALPLPIYNRNQGNIERSSADIVAAQAEICRVQLVLRDQLAESFRRYRNSRLQVDRLKNVILPSAEENLKLTEQVYSVGEAPLQRRSVRGVTRIFKRMSPTLKQHDQIAQGDAEIEDLQLTGGLNPATDRFRDSEPAGRRRQSSTSTTQRRPRQGVQTIVTGGPNLAVEPSEE